MTAKKPVKLAVKKATKAVAKRDVSGVPSPPAVVVSEGPVSAPVPSDAADEPTPTKADIPVTFPRPLGTPLTDTEWGIAKDHINALREDPRAYAVAAAQRALTEALSEQSEASAQLLDVKERLRVAQQTVQYARDDLRRAEVQQ